MTVPPPLGGEEITDRLASMDGWAGDTSQISKTVAIDYHTGVRMIVEVAHTAKEVAHHPDIDLRWGKVRFGITTHDAGYVVTELDFMLAEHIDRIAAEFGATTVSAQDT